MDDIAEYHPTQASFRAKTEFTEFRDRRSIRPWITSASPPLHSSPAAAFMFSALI